MASFSELIFVLCFSLKRKFVDPPVLRKIVFLFLIKDGDREGGGEEVRLM